MKKIISLLSLLGLIFLATLTITQSQENQICESKYILVELEYNSNSISQFTLINKTLETGCYSEIIYNSQVEYNYQLTTNKNSLYQSSFNPSLIFIDGQEEGETELTGGTIEPGTARIFLTLPPESGEVLEIYNQTDKIFETNIFDTGATSCRIK
ncbi:hypothetical protein HN832_00605 [archaeon]|jgi:hypothetical protein|nr:hypothetical protein [archaeon]MBT4373878.1 hypothetical protein [archaeon]MBT4532400.1 hypothetical protein [archaeon]MBT7001781.1 hypothetical protein [archaeon]MBT7281894.1 hypothetical protein [archaeon]